MKFAVRTMAYLPVILVLGSCASSPAPPPRIATPAPVVKKIPVAKKTVKAAELKAAEVTEISLENFLLLQQEGKALIYDARPSFVRAFGHVPGSIGWPRSSFQSDWVKHEPELKAAVAARKPVVIYCTDLECPDARAVAEKVAARGYSVAVLKGGYATWKEAGMPTE